MPSVGHRFETEPELAEPELVESNMPRPVVHEYASAPETGASALGQGSEVQSELDLDSALVAKPVSNQSKAWSPLDIREVKMDAATIGEPKQMTRHASEEGRREADAAVRLGFGLVQRGAPYSARARFIEALRTVARSLDDQNSTSSHSAALRRALSAYQEAADFFPKSTRPDRDVNLGFVVGGHATDVLQHADVQNITPSQCVSRIRRLCRTRVFEGVRRGRNWLASPLRVRAIRMGYGDDNFELNASQDLSVHVALPGCDSCRPSKLCSCQRAGRVARSPWKSRRGDCGATSQRQTLATTNSLEEPGKPCIGGLAKSIRPSGPNSKPCRRPAFQVRCRTPWRIQEWNGWNRNSFLVCRVPRATCT